MNLVEALALRERVARELEVAWHIRHHAHYQGMTSPPDPDVCIVSRDGKDFSILVWRGDEALEYDSAAYWNYGQYRWRQPVFNPDGAWAHYDEPRVCLMESRLRPLLFSALADRGCRAG